MNNITVANYIHRELYKRNIKYVFGYSGGAVLPLLNEFRCNKYPCFDDSNVETLDLDFGTLNKQNNGWNQNGSCMGRDSNETVLREALPLPNILAYF